MNLCFFIGIICSKIQFDFILNSKNISIARFNIKLLNGSIIKVKGYNEIADYCYSKMMKEDIVEIEGLLDSKMEVVLKEIKIMNNLIVSN